MSNLKKYILEQVGSKKLSQDDAFKMLKELQESNYAKDEIAIVGMACKLPEAENPQEFWNNLISEYRCFIPMPSERHDFYDPFRNPHYAEFLGMKAIPRQTETEDTSLVSVITDIDKFDAAFFGIPPREAKYIHPGQRIFLQTAWSAIEDAGYGVDNIQGSNTGVFVGEDRNNTLLYKYITEPDQMHLTGSWEGIMASRINYIFNLRGPAMVLDTACSSGLVAIHEASNALKNHDCEMAIAGGISLGGGTTGTGPDDEDATEDALAAVASDDVVRAFDKKCSGTVFGEGCIAIVLKLLKNAIKDGDNIYGVIKGSALNNDGASNGITAPNPVAQEDVIKEAWSKANINPETVQYVEAHGTGTILGDPIEVKGLTNAFQKFTNKKQFCGLGSLKTNMGHMVGASGCAGVMKVVLGLQNNVIPASMYFEEPNPHINFVESPMFMVDKPMPWEKRDLPRRAGVSSFGFSGTNGHAIIEEAPVLEERNDIKDGKLNVITLSAKSETAINNLVKRYQKFLSAKAELDIKDACYTANTGRGHYEYRIIMLIDDLNSLKEKINLLAERGISTYAEENIFFGQHKIVSDKRQSLQDNEIKEAGLRALNTEVEQMIPELLGADKEIYNNMLQKMCTYYVKGATIDWKKLHSGRKNRRVSLPTYPFDKTHYWADVKKSKITGSVQTENNTKLHYLIDELVISSMNEDIYRAKLSPETHWVLKEHVILGNSTVPGTAYIEIARAIGEIYFNTDELEINNFIFLTPLVVPNDTQAETQIIVSKKDEQIQITVASMIKDEKSGVERWVTHAKGEIIQHKKSTAEILDFTGVISSEDAQESPTNLPALNAQGLMGLGDRWDNVVKTYRLKNVAVSEIKLSDKYEEDLKEFKYHTSVLDMAVNRPVQEYTTGMYLPYYYKKFTMYAPLPAHVFSKATLLDKNTHNDETKTYDVVISDTNGKIVAEIEGYVVKKVNAFNDYVANSFYGIDWVETDSDIRLRDTGKQVLLFKGNSDLSQKVEDKLRESAQNLVTVEFGSEFKKVNTNQYIVGDQEDDYDMLMKELSTDGISDIVHMGTVDFDISDSKIEDYQKAQNNSIYSLLFTSRTMLKNKISGEINFVLVTDNAQEVNGSEKTVKPLNAAFISLAKTIVMEYPNIKIRSIDIDENTDFELVYNEIHNAEYRLRTAYRNNIRYRECLVKQEVSNSEESITGIKIKNQGAYLITGGTGGLGLEVARYLAMKNKTNICLVSRKELPSKDTWSNILQEASDKKLCKIISKIQEIEEQGSVVSTYSSDISDKCQMEAVSNDIIQKFGKINGIFHCAGIAGDGFLFNKKVEVFSNVLNPKIAGTKVLECITENQDLDFLILFSSMTTFFSAPGQGDYTVANAYLDAYAQYRNKMGKRTFAINWSGWSETGMAVDYNIANAVTLFKSIPTNRALSALDTIISTGITNVIPGEIDYDILMSLVDAMPMLLSEEFTKALSRRKKNGEVKTGKATSYESLQSREIVILGKPSDELTASETKLAQIYAAVLELNEIDIYDSFNAMGGDSIIATEVFKILNHFYEGLLEVSDMFVYPTVAEMAEYVDSKLLSSGPSAVEENENVDNMLEKFEEGEIEVEDMIQFFESEED